MKKHPISKSIQTACASGALLLAIPAFAQRPTPEPLPQPVKPASQDTVSEDKGATSEGTISALETDLISVTSATATEPIRFTYSRGTKYVDELGAPVSVTSLKPGVPVTVHYAAVGDSMVANKIVVKRTSKVPNAISDTTLVMATGTISEFGPERLVVSTDSSSEPFSYNVSKKTTFVDETGAVVSTETVKSGLPVTVHYTKADGKFIASKVTVMRAGTTATTTIGTVSEFSPDALVIRTEKSPDPIRYKFSKTTTYVDEAGQPVSVQTVKSGLPVTVHYTKAGGQLVATKVIVRKTTTVPGDGLPETRTETKTTTTTGTINEFGPDRLIVRSETAAHPVTYSFTKTTTYVDETGAPVSVELVKSGLPVTVHYTTEGDTRVATKVVVRKKTTTVVPR